MRKIIPIKLSVSILCLAIVMPNSATIAAETQLASQYYESALTQLQKNDTKAAIIQLKNAIQQQHDYLAAHVLLGQIYLRTKDISAAEAELLQAKQLGADKSLLAISLAQLYLLQMQYAQLIKEFEPEQFDRSLRPDIHIYRGHAFLQISKLNEALNEYALAAQIDPQRIEPVIGKANILLRRNDIKGAQQAANVATQRDPNNADTWYLKAAIKHSSGDLPGALKDYDHAITIAPDHSDARNARAGILMDLHRDEEAENDLNYLHTAYPTDPRTFYLLAVLFQRNQRTEEATKALISAVDVLDNIKPDYITQNAQILMLAGLVNYSLQRFEQAAVYLNQYISRFPDQLAAYKLLASTLMLKGDNEKAIELLKPLVVSAPNDFRLRLLLGTAYMQTGRHEKANALLEQATELASRNNNEDTHTELGLNRLAMGQDKLANQELELAIKNNPDNIKAGIPLVIAYISRHEGENALRIAKAMSEKTPGNLTLLNLLGTAQLSEKQIPAARQTFEQALKLDPDFISAHLNISKLDVATGNIDAAKQRLQTLLAKFPDNIALLIELGRIESLSGQYEAAQKWLDNARKIDPKSLPVILALIELKLQTNRAPEAVAMAMDAEVNVRDNLQLLEVMGRSYLATDNPRKAALVYQRMSRLAGYNAEQLYTIAKWQVVASDPSEAIKTLKNAVLGNESFLPAQALLTELQLNNGEALFAANRAQSLVKQYPERAFGYRLLGDIDMQAGKSAQAVNHYQTAFAKEPDTDLVIRLYHAQHQAGNSTTAIHLLEDWVKRFPQDAAPMLELAEAYLHAEQPKAAQPLYEQMLAKDPKQADILNNLAYIYFTTGDSRALDYAEQAIKISPENPSVIDTLGWILVNQDKASEGLPHLRHANALASGDPEIRFHIAIALQNLNRPQEAKQELEQALKIQPAFQHRNDVKALLKKLGEAK